MNLSFVIGLRFLMAKKSTRFLSLVTRVSVLGLTLGVMALVIVVSVMNGFDAQLKYRILGAVPHIVAQQAPVQNDPSVAASARFLRYQGMVLGQQSRMVSIYGIDPNTEAAVSVLPQHMKPELLDQLTPGSNRVIVGSALAARIGLWPGDGATLLIPVASKQSESVIPKIGKVEMIGSFQLRSELDYGLLVMHVEDLQKLTGAQAVNYRITLHDLFAVSEYQTTYENSVISSWTDEFGDFFATVRMEKIMMFLLLTLIVMIAAFNTVSGLSMMVKEKQAEIAVLRTMGLSTRDITGIFVVQGSVIGIGGVVLGMALGIPVAYHVPEIVGFVEDMMGGRMLAGTYFDRVPTDVRWPDIAVIGAVSLGIAMLATILPAYRAATLQPAQVLRGE